MINIETLMLLMMIHFCGESCIQPLNDYRLFKRAPPKTVASDATISSLLYSVFFLIFGIKFFFMMFFVHFVTKVSLYLITTKFEDHVFNYGSNEHSRIFINSLSQLLCIATMLFLYAMGDYIKLEPVDWDGLFKSFLL